MLLVYLTIAWAGGILFAYTLWNAGMLGCAAPAWPFALLMVGATAALFVTRRWPRRRLAAVLLLFAILGAWRYQAHLSAACLTPSHLAFFNGDEAHTVKATVEGVVIGYPDVRETRTEYRLRAETITVAGQTYAVQGVLLLKASRFPEYRYGDRLRVTGSLQTPPVLDDFDYRAYLAREGIHSLMQRAQVEQVAVGQGPFFWRVLLDLRTRGAALLNRVLPEPAAALANGILLGIESGIPDAVEEALNATGTSHIIVVSGSNIALLSGVLMKGLGRLLGKRRAVWPTAIGIAFYVLLAGADTAAVRAGIMGILYVFANYLGRQNTAYVSLCASALFMTAWNPLTLWDIGFQLSFATTLGMILFTPSIQVHFQRMLRRWLATNQAHPIRGLLNDTLIVTLATQVLTLPLIIYNFGRLSLISLITNFLILPAQPPIMIGGMATLVFGLIWEPLGRVLAVIPWLFLTYMTAVVRLTAAVPLASVSLGDFGRAAALIYLAVLLGVLLWRVAHQRGWTTIPARRALTYAAAIALPAWLGVTALEMRPDGLLHLFFVPGEGGEAALLVMPDGKQAWLWNGQGDGEALADRAQPLLRRPAHGVDAAVGPPGASFWPADQVIDPARLAPGARIRLSEAVTLTRLASGARPVLALDYGQFRALLPAALTVETQANLLSRGADVHVTLLKAPGPNTGAWPTVEFLAAAAPQLILWPQETTYPPAVADLLAARGAARAPADAILEVITDGEQVWLHQRAGETRR